MSGVNVLGGAGSVQELLSLRKQIIDRSSLLQDIHQTREAGGTPPAEPEGSSFASSLRDALEGVSETQAKASDLSEQYERGETTDIASVMLARQEAGVAFEATLQVRNKLLSAYQDIMRMWI